MHAEPNRFFPRDISAYLLFLLLLGIALVFTFKTGASFVWPYALNYTATGHGIAAGGKVAMPFYGWFLSLRFIGGAGSDVESGHRAVILLQAFILALSFFPLRALIVKGGGLTSLQAGLVAAVMVVAPVFLGHAPLIEPLALFIVLLVFFAYAFDRALSERGLVWPLLTGVFGALLLLTDNAGWIGWAAAFLAAAGNFAKKDGARQSALPVLAGLGVSLVLCFAALAVTGTPFIFELSGNNPLVRFNFIKNGILFLVLAGAPYAGFALLMGAVLKGRVFWQEPFFRFAAFALLGVILYITFAVDVIVDRKLDYISNRWIEPFLFLPVVVLFRLPEEARREAFLNGALVFLVLGVLGLPYGLHMDFKSGLTYWSQSLANPHYGIIRNAMYFVLMLLPVAACAFRPKWLVPSYAALGFIFAFTGGAANMVTWHANDEANIAFIDAGNLARSDIFRDTPVFTDYHCNPSENNDVSYLYRCMDVAKALYFVPGRVATASADDILQKKEPKLLFLSSESDNLIGKVVWETALARLMEITPADIGKANAAPKITLERITGASRYINVNINGHTHRITLLDPHSTMELASSKAGCMQMEIRLAMDDAQHDHLTYSLGDEKKGRQVPVSSMRYDTVTEPLRLKLVLPEGRSTLHIRYGVAEKGDDAMNSGVPQSLILLDRPVFIPCN